MFSIDSFRRALATIDSVPQYAVLGIASGIATGLIIIAFRALIEFPTYLFALFNVDISSFVDLPLHLVFLIPLSGGILLALLFKFINPDFHRVGVVHVIARLARHQGHLPWQNTLTQFFGGAIALASGQSGGREGPVIHLGAASSSLIGQALKLPNNSIRVLVGCGTAAAISASFNTPMAGVIFSMEVIILEYTIAGFIPVILAAVSATVITQAIYGNEPAFAIPENVSMGSLYDLPFLILQGIIIGVIASLFIHLVKQINQRAPASYPRRLLLAGFFTAIIALMSPEILGIGYDTVEKALTGELVLTTMLIIIALKIVATAITIALGVPVGVIGPTLFIGALSGGALGLIGITFYPELASNPAFYVILGMGAMMGAVLQAPLAALLTVLELTQNSSIILPAMLVIIVANITSRHVFKMRSIYIMQMQMLGLEYHQNPVSMALNRSSMAAIMSRSYERLSSTITYDRAQSLLQEKPKWLLIDDPRDKRPAFIMPLSDLALALNEIEEDEGDIDLFEIPANRRDIAPILLQATLMEAHELLKEKGIEALYVNRISAPLTDSVAGIILKEDIDTYYQV